jgi:hypothetical protein
MHISAVIVLRCVCLLIFPFLGVLGCGGEGGSGDAPIVAPPGATATLSWDAMPGSTVLGYKIYWGTSSHKYQASTDVGQNTSHTFSNLQHNTEYFFAVTAYNSGGESSFSTEVTWLLH